MGRNSVEATKASLIRAVRARRAAFTAGLTGFLGFLAVELAGFADFPTVGAGFFAVCVVFGAVFCVGFFVVCAGFFVAVEETVPAGLVLDPPEDCPTTGNTIIKKESRPVRQRNASRETKVGEDVTLISSL